MVWSLVLGRLNALVVVADSMGSRKELLHNASNLTGFAFVAYLMSSICQRPNDWSHLTPLKDRLKEFSCPQSSLLFIPGLFKLTDDQRYWQCTANLKQYFTSLYDDKIASKFVDDVIVSSSFVPAVAGVGECFAYCNFTTSVYGPLIEGNVCKFFWDAVTLFKVYGPSTDCVTRFVELLLTELLSKAVKLKKYTQDTDRADQVCQLGHRFFSRVSNLNRYLKVITYSRRCYVDNTKNNCVVRWLPYMP